MKRSFVWLPMIVLLTLVCGCSKKPVTPAQVPNADQAREAEPDVPVIQAATPEDPGPMATVVQPLAMLKGQAKQPATKQQAEVTREPLTVDHPVYLLPEESRNFLRRVFPVKKYVQFAFVVPPHQGHPMLRGVFQSFTKRDAPDSTSDKTADVDLMLLNDQEFDQFRHGQLESATYELDPAHNQMVDWGVPASFDQPQEYHLVFSNSDGSTGTKFVKADFTVSFK
jgi:hypothetical protein